MALEAIAMYPDNSMFKATIRRDPKDTSKFQVINETKISKNQLKNTLLSEYDKNNNLTNQYGGKNTKIDLSAYNIRTFHEYNVNPERNGTYVVSEVITTFGVRGYRQKLKIPYKLSDK